MISNIDKRVIEEALYIIKTKETIRSIAKVYLVSKSTVHKDLTIRLKRLDYNLYENVKKILDYHIKIRHLRGGISTKIKYEKCI